MRGKFLIGSFIVVALGICLLYCVGASPSPVVEDGISVYFSPSGGCTEAIVETIGKAKQTILVQAYSFTSAPIAKALTDAHARGVKVTAIFDKSQAKQKYSSATFLFNHGVPVYIDARHPIAHNKIMLIDDSTVITGSFNFTKAAEEGNAENLLILHDKAKLMEAYKMNFQRHLEHSDEYKGLSIATKPADNRPADPVPVAMSSSAPAKTDQPTKEDPIVYLTRSGTKYHAAGCRYLTKSSLPVTLSEAIAKGHTPCSACNPPHPPN